MRKFVLNAVLVWLFVFFFQVSFSQITKEGTPASTVFKMENPNKVEDVKVDVDWVSIFNEDAKNQSAGLPMRAGISIPVGKGINDFGEWTQLPDGRMMWRVALKAKDANALGIVFSPYELPEGSELYLYNENKTMVNGALGSHNNNPDKVLSTKVLYGDVIIIEYIEKPVNNAPKVKDGDLRLKTLPVDVTTYKSNAKLVVSEIMYMYADVYKVFDESKPNPGGSYSCEIDINCSQGNNWQNQKRGVAHTLNKIGTSWYFCSGTLVNNTAENFIPYFLTAFHCGEGASDADRNQWQFYFNFERPSCGSGTAPTSQMMTGCDLKSFIPLNGGSDMLLVQLKQSVPLSYNPYFNGWDRTNTAATSGVGIHHPAGDVKKISVFNTPAISTGGVNFGSSGTTAANSNWRVNWAEGLTEGGSSGSPMFNQNGLVVGTLSGGPNDDCSTPSPLSYYGKVWYHWDQYSATDPTKHLKTWLDPANTGATTCRGWDPQWLNDAPNTDFTATPTTIGVGQQVKFIDLSTNAPSSWEWNFGPNAIPQTSTEAYPTVVYTTPGTYSVTLKASNVYGSNTITKTNYITVNSVSTPSPNPKIIGTGTSTAAYPFGILLTASYVRSASIYTVSEIGGAGIISKVEWNVGTSRTDQRNILIYIKETEMSEFAGASTVADIISDATLVYSSTFTPNATGWYGFNLQTKYNYSGQKNLMVIVLVNGTAANRSSNCSYTTSTNRHQQWSGTSAPTTTGTINNNRPNIRITFDPFVAPTANFVGVEDLVSEDFEGTTFPPTGWTINNEDGGGQTWQSTTSNNHTPNGVKSAYHQYGTSGYNEIGWLITPQISLPAGGNYILTFWNKNDYPTYYGNNSVRISTTGNSPANFTTTLWSPASVTDKWEKVTIDLSSYAGQNIYIGFRYQGDDAHNWYIDDVKIQKENTTGITVYAGDIVSFIDKSTNNPTTWEWTLPGATTPNVYTKDADVVYNTPGVYNASLRVLNPSGTNTMTKTSFVTVLGRFPVANFTAKGNLKNLNFEPFIPVGATVQFYDKSARVPTSWNWTFSGGTPSSSTLQNPIISYTSTGLKNVSLTVSNAYGSNTLDSTNYIQVGGTAYACNLFENDLFTGYNLTNGQIPGHGQVTSGSSTYYFYEWAEFYDNKYPITVDTILIYVRSAIGTGKTLDIRIYDGSLGIPGTQLASKTVNVTSFTQNALNKVGFAAPVSINGPFYVAFKLNYDNPHNYTTHQFSVYTVADRGEDKVETNTCYTKFGTSSTNALWYSMTDLFGITTSMLVFPKVTYQTPTTYTITLNKTGQGNLYVNGILYTAPVSFAAGTEVTISATPASGWRFDNWTGNGISSKIATYSFTLNENKTITGTFVQRATLTITKVGQGSVKVNNYEYVEPVERDLNTTLALSATPNSGFVFGGWSGDLVSSNANENITLNTNKNVTATFLQQFTLTINKVGNGTIKVNGATYTGPMIIVEGTTVTIEGIPDAGWRFGSWSGSVSSTNATETFVMNSDKTITGTFIQQYTLTLNKNGQGVLKVNGVDYTAPVTVDVGTVLTISATPNSGWRFDAWSGDLTSSNATETVTMNNNKTITATFIQQFTLTLNKVGQGVLKVNGVDYTAPVTVDVGTVLTISATPNSGWRFDAWSGDLNSSNSTETVTMNSNKTITATFIQQFTLTLNKVGQGVLKVNGVDYTSPLTFDAGTVVTISATPNTGWRFGGWSGDLTSPNATETVTMNSNKTITATFIQQYTLTLNKIGQGVLKVNGVDYTAPMAFDVGTVVNISAIPNSSWRFDAWSGDLTSSNTNETVTMNSNKTITATFIQQFTLTLNKVGQGVLKVNGVDYTAPLTFDIGTSVTISATPNTGWRFKNWSGDLNSTNATETFTMNANKTITGTFELIPIYDLTISVSGNGTTTPSPGTYQYQENTVVDLYATPNSGNEFVKWVINGVEYFTQGVQITMTANTNATAYFQVTVIPQYTLSMSIDGNGTTTPPAGNHIYNQNTVVDLTATPAANWTFNKWVINGVDVTANPTSVTMTENKNVVAHFTENPKYTLTINKVGNGTITVNGVEYNDPMQFYVGTNVTIVATPDATWRFDGWTGDVVSSNTTISLTIDGNKSLTATFIKQYTLTLSTVGNGQVKVNGANYTGPITVDAGTALNIEAIANTGWRFGGWSGDLVSPNAIESVVMNSDKNITATFIQQFTLTLNKVGQGTLKVNGSVYTAPMTFDANTNVVVEAIADAGWRFDAWSGDLNSVNTTETITINSNKTVTATFIRQYTLTIYKIGNGSVKVNNVEYTTPVTVDEGTELTLDAVADATWRFDGWSGDIVSSSNTVSVVMNSDKNVSATFIKQYTVTINIVGQGSVLVNGQNYTTPLIVDDGTNLLLQAVPDINWQFAGWSGDLVSTNTPENLTVNSDKNITATFNHYYTLTITTQGLGNVNVNGNPYTAPINILEGSNVIIEATPQTGWHFVQWSGSENSTQNPFTFVMNSNKDISAQFELNTYYLTIYTQGNGIVKVNGSLYSAPVEFTYGDNVTVEAFPASNWYFAGWTGDIVSPNEQINFTIQQNTSLWATFTQNYNLLTINKVGQGTILVNGVEYTQPINIPQGQTVELQAIADATWRFDNWAGDLVSYNSTAYLLVDADKTVTATFIKQHTLTISIQGQGTVKVNGTNYTSPITVDINTTLNLQAVPANNWQFSEWTGDIQSQNAQLQVTLDNDYSLTAVFTSAVDILNIANDITVYPNPFVSELYISNTANINKIEITDFVGKTQILLNIVSAENQVIKTDGLENGVYFLKLYNQNGDISIVKIVKMK